MSREERLLSLRNDLMTSSDLFWNRLRELFEEKGLDPSTCLFDSWSEDTDMEEGWVVTAEGRVFGFDLHFGGGDISSQHRNAYISRWEDMTDARDKWYPQNDVELALKMLTEAT